MTGKTSLHWADEKEQVHSNRPIKLLFKLVAYLPLPLVNILVYPVGFFYLLFSSRARTECILYQRQLIAYTHGEKIKRPAPLSQIISFSLCILEKIEGWSHKMSLDNIVFQHDDVDQLRKQLAQGKGALLIGSHLGNIEMLRSLAIHNETGVGRSIPVTIIMELKSTETFNKTMQELDPGVSMNIVNSAEIGPDTICLLMDRLEAGGMVVIAGDRTSAKARGRVIVNKFLGKDAAFPYGTFVIASLLNVPVYFFFAVRQKNFEFRSKYNMYVNRSSVTFEGCSRSEKEVRIRELCREFVGQLEKYCIEYPFQWYNFYNFWAMPDSSAGVK
jgi:predicted LPLAT superfamily acyltransferase